MCLLIVNKEGKTIGREILERAARNNGDGYGRIDLSSGKIHRTTNMREAVEIAMRPGPAVHHFRYATSGLKTPKQCHPFHVKDGWQLLHNGIITDLDMNDGRPDTENLAALLRLVSPENRAEVLAKFVGNRFALVDVRTKEVIEVGDFVDEDGVHYSNSSCLTGGSSYSYSDHEWERPIGRSAGTELLAVWGHLKYTQLLNWRLRDAQWMGWGFTKHAHRLFMVNGIPRLVRGIGAANFDKDVPCVEMEVYSVDKDTYEALRDFDDHSTSERIPIEMEDGSQLKAWCFFYPEKEDDGTHEFISCFGDSWCEFDKVTSLETQKMIGRTAPKERLRCPECLSEDVDKIQSWIYCDSCFHSTEIAHIDAWRIGTQEEAIRQQMEDEEDAVDDLIGAMRDSYTDEEREAVREALREANGHAANWVRDF